MHTKRNQSAIKTHTKRIQDASRTQAKHKQNAYERLRPRPAARPHRSRAPLLTTTAATGRRHTRPLPSNVVAAVAAVTHPIATASAPAADRVTASHRSPVPPLHRPYAVTAAHHRRHRVAAVAHRPPLRQCRRSPQPPSHRRRVAAVAYHRHRRVIAAVRHRHCHARAAQSTTPIAIAAAPPPSPTTVATASPSPS